MIVTSMGTAIQDIDSVIMLLFVGFAISIKHHVVRRWRSKMNYPFYGKWIVEKTEPKKYQTTSAFNSWFLGDWDVLRNYKTYDYIVNGGGIK